MRSARRLAALAVAAAVVVSAPPTAAAPGPGELFHDDDGNVHEGYIEAVAAEGITSGCGPGDYCPSRTVTRAQMATFLARALGLDTSAAPDHFTDDDGSIFEPSINAVAQANITSGCGGTDFCPGDPVTRAQMAAFLVRAFDLPAAADSVVFDDVGPFYAPDVASLAAAGITGGCGGDSFCPGDPVRRAQMATFLGKALGLTPVEIDRAPAPDTGTSEEDFDACLTDAGHSDLAPDIDLTAGGLPDFTRLGVPLRAETFQIVVDCVPAIGPDLTPAAVSDADRSAAQSVADTARSSVGFIEVSGPGGVGGTGTGFLLSDDGLVMTNQHVVDGGTEFGVWFPDGRRYEATLLGGVWIPDIAVLRIDPPPGLDPLPVGSAAGLTEEDTLVAIGHPAGAGNWVATAGKFVRYEPRTELDRDTGEERGYTTMVATVPAFEGSSGGPLLDLAGRVVGVVYGGSDRHPPSIGRRPHISSSLVREYLTPTDVTNAAPIEHALRVAADVTGDASLAPSSEPDLAPPALPTRLSAEVSGCLSSAIGGLAGSFGLTTVGMPDFSGFGAESLSPSQFEAVIECLPGLALIPSPLRNAEAVLDPVFPTATRSQAQAVGDATRESVVYLDVGFGYATGFLISEDGYILTNRHNVDSVTGSVTVWFIDGRSFEAEIVGVADPSGPDAALLKIDAPSDVEPLTIGTSDDLAPDDPLVVVGHAGGMGNWVVTLGDLVELDETSALRNLVTTVPISSGNSGSPMLDLEGRVVGLVYSSAEREPRALGIDAPEPAPRTVQEFLDISRTSYGQAVPIEDAMSLVEGWIGG